MTAPIMIMAGGTGGHIFPALAVAEWLRDHGAAVVWLGSRGGMETRLVPARGFPMVEISVGGLRGKGAMTLLKAPFKLLLAVWQSIRAQRRHRPRAVLGLGGFASGPGGLAAWMLRTPLYVHEQNAIPGLTNRLLARLARVAMQAFPGSFKDGGALTVGNPVRASLRALPDPGERLKGREGPIRILILGGSLGALKLNQVVPETLAGMARPLDIWHQCGERHQEDTARRYRELGLVARTEAFIEDMAEAWGWADLAICRAGALTISEIAQVGVASVLVPYPHAVDDHQTANAMNLVSRDAALLVPDAELSAERLGGALAGLLEDRERLLRMAEAATALRHPEAAAVVARLCLGELTPDTLASGGLS